MSTEFGSDYELSEATTILSEEQEGALSASPRSESSRKKAAVQVAYLPKKESTYKLIEEIRTLFQTSEEEQTIRQKTLLEKKLNDLTNEIIKEKTGKYGKRTKEIQDEARQAALEMTLPQQKTSFDAGLEPSSSARIKRAAHGALNKSKLTREDYINALANKISSDLRESAIKVRDRILNAMEQIRNGN